MCNLGILNSDAKILYTAISFTGKEDFTFDEGYLWVIAKHGVYVFLQLNDFIFFLKE